MPGVNKVILLGNLGKDPDLRYTQGGMPVANVSLATNERRKKGDEWVDFVEWHSLVVWGKLAEVLNRYCKKGKQVYVEGKLRTRSWEDKNSGEKKYRTEVYVDVLVLLGSKEDAEGGRRERETAASEDYESSPDSGYRDDEDDLPF